MVNILALKAAMVKKGYTQKTLAKELGISERTLNSRLKNKCFGTNEIEILVDVLGISDPIPIFFDGLVTSKDTK